MILLDTHAFVWLASDPKQLSKAAWRFLENNPDELAISIVTSWEVALLHKKGQLELPLAPADFISRALEHHGISELNLSRDVILHALGLADIHKDPFDRILVAEAITRNIPIVTKDRFIGAYPGIRTIW